MERIGLNEAVLGQVKRTETTDSGAFEEVQVNHGG
jgi:hypothetical protein